jgi:ribosome modulation factor
MEMRQPPILKAISEGARARAIGRPKDACPYPANSPERKAGLEGYDGTPAEDGPDLPIADA